MRKRRHLDNWLKTFCQTFQNTESPEKYVYWIGVGTIGAALQRNVCFDQVTFQLYPNHYIILVGPPAVKKTTAIYFGVDLLRKVEGINVGPSSVTWQYLVDKLKEIQTATPEEMAKTGQAIKESCPIILPAGELGTLIDFDDRGSIDFFTNSWDSPNVYDKGTRMMGDQLLNGPCVSIIAGTTPQWLKDNIRGATRGGGFISRCIMPFSNKSRKIVTYPDEHVMADHAEQLSKLHHDLMCIATLTGKYVLSPEARIYGKEWDKATKEKHDKERSGVDSDNWVNRKFTHVHKLAMILAASKRDELVIEKEDLVEAVRHIDEIGQDFNKVFELLDQRKETNCTREIEGYMRARKRVSLTDLMVDMRHKFTKREIAEALEVLLAGRIITKDAEAVTVKTAQGVSVVSVIVITYTGNGDE